MIGALNLRWLQHRAVHLAEVTRREQLEAALVARRDGREERSHRTWLGHAGRIHKSHQRDVPINQGGQ